MSWLFCLLFSFSHAGFLRMVGTPHLQIQQVGSKTLLRGDYQILNEGDEAAIQVFPEFQIDGFNWKGEPQELQAGQGARWHLEEEIQKICTSNTEDCLVALPKTGEFVVKVQKHYRDMNKYEFIVPDLFLVTSENFIASEQKPIQLEMKITPPEAVDNQYRVEYTAKNTSQESLKVLLSPLLPQEMALSNAALPVDIPPEGQIEGSFEFRNLKGTPGSNYVGFITAEWSQGKSRFGSYAYATFQIEKPKSRASRWSPDQVFLAGLLWALLFGFWGMWAFWIRPLRALK